MKAEISPSKFINTYIDSLRKQLLAEKRKALLENTAAETIRARISQIADLLELTSLLNYEEKCCKDDVAIHRYLIHCCYATEGQNEIITSWLENFIKLINLCQTNQNRFELSKYLRMPHGWLIFGDPYLYSPLAICLSISNIKNIKLFFDLEGYDKHWISFDPIEKYPSMTVPKTFKILQSHIEDNKDIEKSLELINYLNSIGLGVGVSIELSKNLPKNILPKNTIIMGEIKLGSNRFQPITNAISGFENCIVSPEQLRNELNNRSISKNQAQTLSTNIAFYINSITEQTRKMRNSFFSFKANRIKLSDKRESLLDILTIINSYLKSPEPKLTENFADVDIKCRR